MILQTNNSIKTNFQLIVSTKISQAKNTKFIITLRPLSMEEISNAAKKLNSTMIFSRTPSYRLVKKSNLPSHWLHLILVFPQMKISKQDTYLTLTHSSSISISLEIHNSNSAQASHKLSVAQVQGTTNLRDLSPLVKTKCTTTHNQMRNLQIH